MNLVHFACAGATSNLVHLAGAGTLVNTGHLAGRKIFWPHAVSLKGCTGGSGVCTILLSLWEVFLLHAAENGLHVCKFSRVRGMCGAFP